MKVMVIVKATKASEAGVMPSTELLEEMGNFNEELAKAGILLAGEGLHPSSKGVRVRFSGKERHAVDGPFDPPEALIAGYWLWKVASMEEAVAWVKRCPNPHREDSEIEIRQVFAPEDFGEAMTPELREREASLLAQTLGLAAPRFEDCPERLVAGVQAHYTMETRVQIPAQWERFAPQLGSVPGQIGTASYGVAWNYKPSIGFDYLTGVEVAEGSALPAGYSQVTLPALRYAVFVHRGHISGIEATFDTIWTKWVPDCGLPIADAPCFECYTDRFDPATGTGEVDLFIGLGA